MKPVNNELYSYVPITERKPVIWPDGKRIAFYVGLNIEHFRLDPPVFGAIARTAPDPLSHGSRDYGNRVGIWRLIDLFDEVGVRPSAITSSEVCEHYPQIIEAGIAREWVWVAHGKTNTLIHSEMDEAEEAAFLDEMFATYDAALLARPRGWLGPSLTETFNTPRLLQERGVTYLLDWVADDRPFELNVPNLISVPYNLVINDLPFFMDKTVSGELYEKTVMDHFEVLLEEGGNVIALPLHPFIIGQPARFKYVRNVIRAITSHREVWVTTSDDIADHYLSLQA